jgi:hypothetical protein
MNTLELCDTFEPYSADKKSRQKASKPTAEEPVADSKGDTTRRKRSEPLPAAQTQLRPPLC